MLELLTTGGMLIEGVLRIDIAKGHVGDCEIGKVNVYKMKQREVFRKTLRVSRLLLPV